MARSATRRTVQRLTSEDLEYCTCGQCQVGDPVRSVGGGYLMEDEEIPPEVFPVVTLPPSAELAASALRAPLVNAAVRLAAWCGAGRQVTAKGVLRPALARQAVDELELWKRDPDLHDPDDRADVLSRLRSAGDLEAIDIPWRFAVDQGFIEVTAGKAIPGPDLPDADGALELWQETFEEEIDTLDSAGTTLLPGMFGMVLGNTYDSAVFPLLMTLYSVPDGEWLGIGDFVAALGDDTPVFQALLAFETGGRLADLFEDFGAGEMEREGVLRLAEDDPSAWFLDAPLVVPAYRMRLTPLGRHGIRAILAGQGHIVPVTGELADADAATLLDSVTGYDPDSLRTELTGWLASRDGEADAVREILDAVTGDADPESAVRRTAATAVFSVLQPSSDAALTMLRDTAADGPDGRRHVAAGVLLRLGETEPSAADGADIATWMAIDTLSVLSVSGMPADMLPPELMTAISGKADDLWRCDHPATADTLEATAELIRDTDKALAKRLRRSAHKARARA